MDRIDFGLVMSWLVPGFVAFLGLGYVSEYVDDMAYWIYANDTGFGAAVATVLMSLVIGLVISAVRQVVLDRIHFSTGIDARATVQVMPQVYGNMALAIALAVAAKSYATPVQGIDVALVVAGILACVILLVAHRAGLRAAE